MPFGLTNVPLPDTITINDMLISHTPHVDITLLFPMVQRLLDLRAKDNWERDQLLVARPAILGQLVRVWLNLHTQAI